MGKSLHEVYEFLTRKGGTVRTKSKTTSGRAGWKILGKREKGGKRSRREHAGVGETVPLSLPFTGTEGKVQRSQSIVPSQLVVAAHKPQMACGV